jgi:hypothetical protein
LNTVSSVVEGCNFCVKFFYQKSLILNSSRST